ncbi:MAG: PAS domain S-box protein [Verrucomicrobiaceae bacterium]
MTLSTELTHLHWSAIIESSDDAIFSKTLDGIITSWNPGAERLFGYTAMEAVGMPVTRLSLPDRLGEEAQLLASISRGEKVSHCETVRVTKDGRQLHVSATISPVKDSSGRIVGASSIIRDITERWRADEALRLNRENLDVTLRSIGDAVLATDAQRRITRMNSVAEKLTGWPEAEALGRPVDEVFRIINEETRQPAVIPVDDVLATGETHGLANHTVLLARDGREISIEDSAAPIRDTAGAVQGVVLVFRNVSEERTAEKRAAVLLQELEDMKRTLDQHSIVAITDARGRITYANDKFCEISQYSREELLGQDHRILNSGHHPKEFFHDLWRTISNGGVWKGEIKNRAKSGLHYWVATTIVPFLSADGKPYRFVAIRTEITAQKCAVEALRTSEERLSLAIETANLGLWEVDLRTGSAHWSEATYRQLGLPPDPEGMATVDTWRSLVLAEDLPSVDAAFKQALEKSAFFKSEHRHRRADTDEVRWNTVSARFDRNAAGEAVRMLGISFDSTEQKHAEDTLRRSNEDLELRVRERTAALRDSEERLRLFIENAPAALAMCDKDMRYLVVSQNWLRDYGLAGRDIIGLSHYTVFPEIPERWKEVHRRALAGEVIDSKEDRFERADGTVHWLRWQVRPWHSPEGAVSGIIMFSEDITRRREDEEALRESEMMQRKIFSGIDEIIYRVRTTEETPYAGEVLFVSPKAERILGYSSEDFIHDQSLWFQLVHPEDHAALRESTERIYSSKRPGEREYRIRIKSGEYRWIEDRVTPEVDDHGNLTGIFGVARDITERVQAETRMEQSLREKETLLKEIHHRVKNNLQVISSLLAMRADTVRDENARTLLQESQHRVRAMGMIHERLYQTDTLARVDFGEYVRQLTGFLHRNYAATSGHVQLSVEADKDVMLNIDTSIPVGLILNELVSNAFKHAFKDGAPHRLEVRLHRVAEGFSLSVTDDGPGLPAGFDIAQSQSLGLELVDTLVAQIKGHLTISSQGGTTFRLDFNELVYAERN